MGRTVISERDLQELASLVEKSATKISEPVLLQQVLQEHGFLVKESATNEPEDVILERREESAKRSRSRRTKGVLASHDSTKSVTYDDLSSVIEGKDSYTNRLMKYIPGEVVALYLTLDSILRSAENPATILFWIIFVFGLIATPLYLWRVTKVQKKMQLLISTGAFVVWVLAIGGPFTFMEWYSTLYGAMALPIYTFTVALYEA